MTFQWPTCHQPSVKDPARCRLCGRPIGATVDHPINLLPIREAVRRHQTGEVGDEWLGGYAEAVIPALCDEIVRLRAIIADQQVIPA